MKLFFLTLVLFIAQSNMQLKTSNLSEKFKKQKKTSERVELSDFGKFYISFREAVLKKDTILLKELTSFPLKIWGFEDDDPKIELLNFDMTRFENALNSYADMDPKTNEPRSTINFFLQIENIQIKKNFDPNLKEQQIGDLVFKKVNNQWKLIIIFSNTKG